ENDQRSPWYALARASYAYALYMGGDLENAAAHAQEALVSNASIAGVRLPSFAVMSLIAIEEGRLDQAEAHARAALRIVDEPGVGTTPQSTVAYTVVGAVYAS